MVAPGRGRGSPGRRHENPIRGVRATDREGWQILFHPWQVFAARFFHWPAAGLRKRTSRRPTR